MLVTIERSNAESFPTKIVVEGTKYHLKLKVANSVVGISANHCSNSTENLEDSIGRSVDQFATDDNTETVLNNQSNIVISPNIEPNKHGLKKKKSFFSQITMRKQHKLNLKNEDILEPIEINESVSNSSANASEN